MARERVERLQEDGLIDEICQRVKTGKEAEVFVVRKGDQYFAAKVYKERNERNFKNNVGYREGRAVRNSRDARAMAKGSKYGLAKSESEWMHTEHDALSALMHAGVRVPKPELFYEGVLLMELVLGTDGQPAPRLIEVPMTPEEAVEGCRFMIEQIIRMLCTDRIHGDLSPYNVLLAWDGLTIIDIPQVVSASHNSQAEKFLVRDVRNIVEHFAKLAPELKSRLNDGSRIFKAYERRELAPGWLPEAHPELDAIRSSSEIREARPARVTGGKTPKAPRPHGPRGHAPRPATAPAPPPAGAPAPQPNRPARPDSQPIRTHKPNEPVRPAKPGPFPPRPQAPAGRPPRHDAPPRPANGHAPPAARPVPPPTAAPANGAAAALSANRPPHRDNRPPPRPDPRPPRGPEIVRVGPLRPPTESGAPASSSGPTPPGAPAGGAPGNRHRFRHQRQR